MSGNIRLTIEYSAPFNQSLEGQYKVSESGNDYAYTQFDGMKVVRFAPTKPLPTYLIAFAVGEFDVVEAPDLPVTDVRDRPLPLRGIAVKGKGEQPAYALEGTNAIVTVLESYFGTPERKRRYEMVHAHELAHQWFGDLVTPA